MVLKFNDFINENYSDPYADERHEHDDTSKPSGKDDVMKNTKDIINYIDKIEWVDLGHPKYLFSKYDMKEIYVNDLLKIKNKELLPEDISFVKTQQIVWLCSNCNFNQDSNNVICKRNNNEVYFNLGNYFTGWIKFERKGVDTSTNLKYVTVDKNINFMGMKDADPKATRYNEFITKPREYWSGNYDKFYTKLKKRK